MNQIPSEGSPYPSDVDPIILDDGCNLTELCSVDIDNDGEVYDPEDYPLDLGEVDELDIIATLSSQQRIAFDGLLPWIESPFVAEQIQRLNGYAGTGKSYLVGCLIATLAQSGSRLSIDLVAPSHKAKRNLERFVVASLPPSHDLTLNFRTLASFLGQSPELNKTTGREEFVSKGVSDNDVPADLVILDEYGMVGKANSDEIIKRSLESKILLLGDPAQLSPIGEKNSPLAEIHCTTYSLTEVVRYSGDLLKVATSWIYTNDLEPIPLDTTEDGSILKIKNRSAFIGSYAEAVKQILDSEDRIFDDAKMIAYTNKECAILNAWVRSIIWDEDVSESPIKGDRLIAKKPIFRERITSSSNKSKDKWEIVSENSMEFTVTADYSTFVKVIGGTKYSYLRIKAVADYRLATGTNLIDIRYLLDTERKKYDAAVKDLRTRKQWGQLKDLVNFFDDVDYSYCITCHKAQGSTYRNVWLSLVDLNKCPDRERIIYTALTRAKEHVYI